MTDNENPKIYMQDKSHLNLLVIVQSIKTTIRTAIVEKLYVGNTWATDLIMMFLPVHKKLLDLQPLSLAFSLSIKNLKSLDLMHEENIGAPK